MKLLKIATTLAMVLAGTVASAMSIWEAMESGDLEQAKKLATAKLATSPDDYWANLALAFASEAEEKYDEQVKHLEKCLQVREDDKAALNSLAKLGSSLGCRCPGGPGIDWWKGGEKLAQTGLHHGKALWWEGFAWDFLLTQESQRQLGDWLTKQGIDLKPNPPTNEW